MELFNPSVLITNKVWKILCGNAMDKREQIEKLIQNSLDDHRKVSVEVEKEKRREFDTKSNKEIALEICTLLIGRNCFVNSQVSAVTKILDKYSDRTKDVTKELWEISWNIFDTYVINNIGKDWKEFIIKLSNVIQKRENPNG